MVEIKEYVLSIDDYNNPKIFKNEDAVVVHIIRLFLLNPGEIETHPNMGIGLYKNYRFSDMDDINLLKLDAEKQISQYLPILQNVSVDVQKSTENNKEIVITIKADNTIYSLMTNSNEKTISLKDL